MSLGFAVRCLCGAGLMAALVSLAIGAVLPLLRRWLHRLAPPAQARLYLLLAAAPAFVALTLQAGWVIHFHLIAPGPGSRDHQCPIPMTPVLLAAGALLTARLALASMRTVASAWRSLHTVRGLCSVSSESATGFRLCPDPHPQAFVAGLLRPRIFVSQGLLSAIDQRGLSTILAHERAHVRRRDPLRRLLASPALAFHLPGVAASLESDLARAHEYAADWEAAGSVGDAPGVAEALVQVARLQLVAAPAAAQSAAIGGADLEARVQDLLCAVDRRNAPGLAALCAALAAAFATAVTFAVPLHEAAEAIVTLLGG